MTLNYGKKLLPEGFNVCINYEFNLLDHVGVVQKYTTGRTARHAVERITREHNAFAHFVADIRTNGQPEKMSSRRRHNKWVLSRTPKISRYMQH